MTPSVRLRLASNADAGDLAAFVDRMVRLDRDTLVRLGPGPRAGEYLAAYARLPFDVLVGRSVRGALDGDADLTCRAVDLAAALGAAAPLVTSPEAAAPAAGPAGEAAPELSLPASVRRDAQWRGTLPPASGWRLVDTVPVAVVRQVVEAGARTFRAAQARTPDPRSGQAAADALLDHGALTVSDDDHSVVLPLRVLQAAWRMGFLGPQDGDACAVAVRGRWVRLAAPYGTAYRESGVPFVA